MRQQQLPPLPLVYYQEKFYELLEAVDFCHSLGILHRDLKPQNILVSREGELKVADWGLARTFRVPNAEKTQEIVTLWYRAPEILLGENCYTVGVDMWSVGCILAEFITRRPLFASDGTQIGQLFKIFQCTGTPTDQEWPQM
jgi:serine/threonine protein kinase